MGPKVIHYKENYVKNLKKNERVGEEKEPENFLGRLVIRSGWREQMLCRVVG